MKSTLIALAALACSIGAKENCLAQPAKASLAKTASVLSLTRSGSGQRFVAHVGQTIQIDLQAIGTSGYGLPQISSSNISFENSVLLWPVTPAGPLPMYMFRAMSPGEAQIQFQSDRNPTLEFNIHIRPASTNSPASPKIDQANRAEWKQAWTSLNNPLRQDFVPSFPRLTSIDVELVLANPGPSQGQVQMTLLNPAGNILLVADKIVPADNCDQVSFFLPAGLELSPDQTYSIQLSDGDSGLFGWKYVIGGYARGDGWFDGKRLVKDGRGTFLFRTFGIR
jgi:hypothetical protein